MRTFSDAGYLRRSQIRSSASLTGGVRRSWFVSQCMEVLDPTSVFRVAETPPNYFLTPQIACYVLRARPGAQICAFNPLWPPPWLVSRKHRLPRLYLVGKFESRSSCPKSDGKDSERYPLNGKGIQVTETIPQSERPNPFVGLVTLVRTFPSWSLIGYRHCSRYLLGLPAYSMTEEIGTVVRFFRAQRSVGVE